MKIKFNMEAGLLQNIEGQFNQGSACGMVVESGDVPW
jgi:hypothetical protein